MNSSGALTQIRGSADDRGQGQWRSYRSRGGSGALALTQDHAFLLAVNAGSGDISVFRVRWTMLSHWDKVPCGGSEPVAIGQHRDLVYGVKAGGSSNLKRQSSRLCS